MIPCAALITQPSSLVIACSAAVALATASLGRPIGRLSFAAATTSAAIGSIVAGITYRGPLDLAGLWGVAEGGALLVMAGRVARRLPARSAIVTTVVLEAALVALCLRSTLRVPVSAWEESAIGAVLATALLACAVCIGLYLRLLDDRRDRAVAGARRAQRLDVARDLHDFVAHEVTGILIEAQAAQLDGLEPAEAGQMYRRIEDACVRALSSMDRALEVLRNPENRPSPAARPYGMADLPALIGRFTATGSASVELSSGPDLPAALPWEIDTTVYHVVLEALTNVRRHAVAVSRVLVAVHVTRSDVVVTVTDDGHKRHALAGDRRKGTGLAGLAERARALGGTVTAGRTSHGWRVRCALPLE
ncbi:sensor histidine kinase [Nonomuraea sp. JJY05]|uniref:sensor histidine kinase n=1 Tax=Nonomuraea sp. JJY05 TaxID=3350255 RepID=UPI00374A814B